MFWWLVTNRIFLSRSSYPRHHIAYDRKNLTGNIFMATFDSPSKEKRLLHFASLSPPCVVPFPDRHLPGRA